MNVYFGSICYVRILLQLWNTSYNSRSVIWRLHRGMSCSKMYLTQGYQSSRLLELCCLL